MAPFRELLEKKRSFYWDETLESLFKKSKSTVVNSIQNGVRTFETNRHTCLATDWSKTGIGFTLSQKHCSCPIADNPLCGSDHWRVVYAGSRFTRNAESRYAPIEGEALALLFGLESCKMFVMGCPNLIVAVDHKPLVRIFNNRSLDEIKNPRILKMREKTLMFKFRVVSIPGKSNCGPDAVSRIPILNTDTTSVSSINDIETALEASISFKDDHKEPIRITKIKEEASCDNQYRNLIELIQQGFPERKIDVPIPLREFWSMRHDLYTIRDLVFIEGKTLIPLKLRSILVELLHGGHQGVNAMKANARQRFFWPGMSAQIQNRRDQCHRCNDTAPSNHKEPLTQPQNPEYPFQQVVTDIFHMVGRKYIVYADRLSGWSEVASTNPDSKAHTICNILRRYFINFGVPEEISFDGGPPFDSMELKQFLQDWGVQYRLSSAYFPQSNGRAEAAVKTMKRILTTNVSPSGSLDNNEVAKALLLHRNTPPPDIGASPAELLFGRHINDHMPSPSRFRKEWSELADGREKAMRMRHLYATKHENTTELKPFYVGDIVSVQNQRGHHPTQWNNTGSIIEALPHRQYRVLVDGSRRTTLRNRRFLRKIDPIVRDYEMHDTIPEITSTPSASIPQHPLPERTQIPIIPHPTEEMKIRSSACISFVTNNQTVAHTIDRYYTNN